MTDKESIKYFSNEHIRWLLTVYYGKRKDLTEDDKEIVKELEIELENRGSRIGTVS